MPAPNLLPLALLCDTGLDPANIAPSQMDSVRPCQESARGTL